MNLDECKTTVASALNDLTSNSTSVGVYLAIKKLQAALADWPSSDAETARLMKFERDARAVMGNCYAIQNSTWQGSDGKPVELRILDNANVLRALKGEPLP